jgi:CBS domain-containing protein
MKNKQVRDFEVRDFMSKRVLTVVPQSKVSDAVETMVKNDIGCLVVVEKGLPVGMFTERDLLTVLADGRNPRSIPVKDAMSPSVTRISSDQRSQEAARKMIKSKGRLLVFDNANLAGIVTASDIVKVIYRMGVKFEIANVISKKVVTMDMKTRVRFVIREMKAKGVGSVIVTENKIPSRIFTERDLLNKILYADLGLETAVNDVSSFPLVTAEVGINGSDVAGAMVSRRVKRLPLMQRGKMVGIVTARDLVQAFAYPEGVEDSELLKQAKVRYGELCPLCNTRIDDRGLCACGAGGE